MVLLSANMSKSSPLHPCRFSNWNGTVREKLKTDKLTSIYRTNRARSSSSRTNTGDIQCILYCVCWVKNTTFGNTPTHNQQMFCSRWTLGYPVTICSNFRPPGTPRLVGGDVFPIADKSEMNIFLTADLQLSTMWQGHITSKFPLSRNFPLRERLFFI